MNAPKSFTLFHERMETKDGPDTTRIDLVFNPDGSLRIDGVYAGPAAEAFWGDWDHEFWIDVPAESAHAFLALLARDAFTRDGRLTFGELVKQCEATGITFNQGSWT